MCTFLFSEVLTQSEQKELIDSLKSEIGSGVEGRAFPLGLIYEDGIIDYRGKKTPNIQLADKYFIMAYDQKDYRSVFKLTVFLIKKKQYKEALKILKVAIHNSKSRKVVMGAVTTYGTLVMDYLPREKEALINSVSNFSVINNYELDNVPTAKFTKALLLAAIGNTQKAEVLLNEACFSPKAPEGLKRHCFNPDNFIISKDDVEKSIEECATCNLIRN